MPTSIFMDWRSVTGAGAYILQRSSSLLFTSAVTVYNDQPSTYEDTGLTAGTKYYYRVKATAGGFNDSGWLVDSATTSSSTYDPDAQRYLDSAGIGAGTFATAVHALFYGLKSGLKTWNKMICIYPYGGSTFSSMKWNARFPLNDDLAYRIVEIGSGFTYNSAGVTFNGSTQLHNTKFTPAPAGCDFTTGIHISFYSATNAAVNNYMMGCFNYVYGAPNPDNVSAYVRVGAGQSTGVKQNSLGRHIFNRPPSSNTQRYLHNGTVIINAASTFSKYQETSGNNEIYIGGLNDVSDIFFNGNFGFSTIGYGLTTAEEAELDSLIQTFITAIGR